MGGAEVVGLSVLGVVLVGGVSVVGVAVAAQDDEDQLRYATVERVVDGDTVETDRGTVRFIGMDAPEMDTKCGPPAREHLLGLVPVGSRVEIRTDETTYNQDKYGRYLRYLVTDDGTDVGYQMIQDEWAVARYDSRDGYEEHRNESVYRSASADSVDCVTEEELRQQQEQVQLEEQEREAEQARLRAEREAQRRAAEAAEREAEQRRQAESRRQESSSSSSSSSSGGSYSGNRAPCRHYQPDGSYIAVQPGMPGYPL